MAAMEKQIRRSDQDDDAGGDDPGGGKGSLSWDDVFDLLSNERRRLALERVARSRGPVDVQDVVDFVHENQSKPDEETSRKATYVALHQVHFPTLAENDVVVWDQDAGELYLGRSGPLVVDAMSRAVDRDGDAQGFRDRLRDLLG